MNPLALSVRDACASLSIGKTTIYALIRAKRLKAVRIGGRTVIPVESLLKLISGEGPSSDAPKAYEVGGGR